MMRTIVAGLLRAGVGLGALGCASASTAQAVRTLAPEVGTPTPAPDAAATAQPAAPAAPAAAATPSTPATASAITTFDAPTLQTRRLTTTLDVARFVPNMVGVRGIGPGSANDYTIRGLGSDVTTVTIDPEVATYLDGIYLGRQSLNNLRLFDAERVDIRRGPQGTLYGRNSNAGVIDVMLAGPTDRLSGFVDGGYGAYNQSQVSGAISLPLATGFALKLSGYYQRDDGYTRNTTTGERTNTDGASGIRAALHLDLTEEVSWDSAVTYMRDTSTNLLDFTCDPNRPAACGGRFSSTGLRRGYDLAHPSPFVALGISGRKANFGLGNSADTLLYSSDIGWQSDDFRVDLVTGVIDTKQKYAVDLTDGRGAPFPNAGPAGPATGAAIGYDWLNDGSHSAFSQEAKLAGRLLGGRIEYVAGVIYYTERDRSDFADVLRSGPVARVLADRTLRNGSDTVAGYAEVDLHMTAALTLTGGARYTDERTTLSVADNRPQCQAGPAPGCFATPNLFATVGGVAVPFPTSQTMRRFTPRAVAAYRLPGVLLYAIATSGYRSAGWNGRALTPSKLLPVGAEQSWSYAAGAKADMLGHRLSVDVSGFWADTTGVSVQSTQFGTPAPAFVSQTVGSVRNRGLEVEIAARPTPRINLFANLGYQRARYVLGGGTAADRYGVSSARAQQAACLAQIAGGGAAPDCATGVIDSRGMVARPPRSPDYTLSAGATYDYPVPAAGIVLQPRVDVGYVSNYATGGGADLARGRPAGNAHTLVDAGIALRTDDDNWTLTVECRNCFDRAVRETTFLGYDYLGPPRRWMVRARRVF